MEEALRYNTGKPQWSLVHYKSLEPMIRVLEYGAHKYSIFINDNGTEYRGSQLSPEEAKEHYILVSSGRDNWKKPMDLKKILESMQRHIAALMDGEEFDSESGISHIGHVQCNCLFYDYHKTLQDNRRLEIQKEETLIDDLPF